ncbi:MAG: hypothetical protein JJ975_06115 [Bacteroidia bacterium]|nr:hypothetical protein [Bacteroidia bacterium]
MNKNRIFTTFFLVLLAAFAQAQPELNKASIGYFSHGGIHPGGKIGAEYVLSEKMKPVSEVERKISLLMNPQIGGFIRENFYTGILVNNELGLQRQRTDRKRYSIYSIGLGYLHFVEVVDYTVNLQGEITNKTRENRPYFFPSVNYALGRDIGERFGIYGKLTYGMRMTSARENATQLFVEFGMKLGLNN